MTQIFTSTVELIQSDLPCFKKLTRIRNCRWSIHGHDVEVLDVADIKVTFVLPMISHTHYFLIQSAMGTVHEWCSSVAVLSATSVRLSSVTGRSNTFDWWVSYGSLAWTIYVGNLHFQKFSKSAEEEGEGGVVKGIS